MSSSSSRNIRNKSNKIYTHTHTYTHNIHMYIHTCIHTAIQPDRQTHRHNHTDINSHINCNISMLDFQKCSPAEATATAATKTTNSRHIHTYVHTNIHMYIHTYMHTYGHKARQKYTYNLYHFCVVFSKHHEIAGPKPRYARYATTALHRYAVTCCNDLRSLGRHDAFRVSQNV